MSRRKGRGEDPPTVMQAVEFVTKINKALVDIEGLSAWHLVEMKLIPDDGDDYYQFVFLDEVLYESGDPFNETEIVEMAIDALEKEAVNSVLQKDAVEDYLQQIKRKGVNKNADKNKKLRGGRAKRS